jgi:hypothetical protein
LNGEALVAALHDKLVEAINAIRTDLGGLDSKLNLMHGELVARMNCLEERVRQLEVDVQELKEKPAP